MSDVTRDRVAERSEAGSAVVVRDLDVSFGDQPVLDGVDLAVDRGTFVGLVGPNGAGKTTLLRTVRGTLAPDAGTVTVAGERVERLGARERGRLVASVPQTSSVSFDFTVERVVEMGRTPHLGRFERRDATDREAVDRAMERADVADLAERPFTEVSGGERRRVLLARALAQETPVLLLDEPTASLDITHSVRTLDLVDRLVGVGKTVVAAIHDLDLAGRYCDELALLAGGRVRAAGAPSAVLTRATLGDAFDGRALVTRQPVSDAPLVTPVTVEDVEARVHVVGTGGRAATAVARLVAAGCAVSVGVVPEGDAAAVRADELDCATVTVRPFAGVDEASRARAIDLASEADAVVVAGEPTAGNRPVVAAGDRVVRLDDSSTEELLDAVAKTVGSE